MGFFTSKGPSEPPNRGPSDALLKGLTMAIGEAHLSVFPTDMGDA